MSLGGCRAGEEGDGPGAMHERWPTNGGAGLYFRAKIQAGAVIDPDRHLQ
jgi:hypothetical protein